MTQTESEKRLRKKLKAWKRYANALRSLPTILDWHSERLHREADDAKQKLIEMGELTLGEQKT